jgi:hypothetical protein
MDPSEAAVLEESYLAVNYCARLLEQPVSWHDRGKTATTREENRRVKEGRLR